MSLDFTPKHTQPFSLAQARQLDVSTLNQEIDRLRNSLNYLNRTQSELKDALDGEDDYELRKALNENEEVIASQRERISMLEMVLEENGVNIRSLHLRQQPYELASTTQPQPTSTVTALQTETQPPHPQGTQDAEMDEGEGVYL